MKSRIFLKTGLTVLILAITAPFLPAADISQETMAKYILATAKAFRTVYSKSIVEQAKKAGVKPNENWSKDDHAIMLPAQFLKAAGGELKDFELGLIGLQPLYKENMPKTPAETEALKKLTPGQVVTFQDGNQFKGLAADVAINKSCADCHNAHPGSAKKDWKEGDMLGAIVVRFNK
jgi:hypothetical protein